MHQKTETQQSLPTDPPASYVISFLWRLPQKLRPSSEIFLHQLTGTQFWMLVPEGQGVPATHLHEACLVTEPTSLSHFQHQIAIRYREWNRGEGGDYSGCLVRKVCPEGEILGENWNGTEIWTKNTQNQAWCIWGTAKIRLEWSEGGGENRRYLGRQAEPADLGPLQPILSSFICSLIHSTFIWHLLCAKTYWDTALTVT